MSHACPIIPVLDLMIGQIVLASGGNRDQYQPVDSRLTRSSRPLDVAKAMFLQTGCDWIYLADIDSFSGAQPNWNVYNELLNAGFGVWIDANWIKPGQFEQLIRHLHRRERLKIILSSETMSAVSDFNRFAELIAAGIEPIFSLDKKQDRTITQPGELATCSSLELVQLAYEQGVRDLIVLDLSCVGTKCGCQPAATSTADPSYSLLDLLREIHSQLPDISLTTGGGVRHAEDVTGWLETGCRHVLVATALHECRFTPDDIQQLKQFQPRHLQS